MKHTPFPPLPLDFEVPEPVATWADTGAPTWTSSGEPWSRSNPPEESAIPPRLAWTEDDRRVLLDGYNAQRWKYLEEGQEYAMSWPPTASLWKEGHVVWGSVYDCSEHGIEVHKGCAECAEVESPSAEVTLAEWHWYVTVETLEECGNNSWSQVDSEQLHFLTTEVDPREVEYRDRE
jgi:hypothetical protein